MPLTYANAFGGPAYAKNPAGKGHRTTELPTIEDPREPVRSRSAALDPAGFGPISPSWPQRSSKLGKDYGANWKKTRAPYYAADFDWSFFNAAPPDQQIEGYLRGDEELAFDCLHLAARHFRARLPGVCPRVLVRHTDGTTRNVPMVLDTLVADLDAERLVLVWRGLTPVAEDDLDDVRTLFIACETLADRRPPEEYLAALDAFEADPLERDKAFPAEVKKRIADAQAAAEALIAEQAARPPPPPPPADPFEGLSAKLDEHLKDKLPEERERAAAALARLRGVVAANEASFAGGPKVAPPPQTEEGMMEALAKNLASVKELAASKGVPTDRVDSAMAALERSRAERKAQRAQLEESAKADPRMAAAQPKGEGEPPPPPGPGVNLMGRDFSGRDLRGLDLQGALLRGANLARANLAGANLTRADLGEVDLTEADLTRANLNQANLMGARGPRAVFDGANLSRTIFKNTDLSGASLRGATCEMTLFVETVLTGATLAAARFTRVLFGQANLDGANLSGAVISISTFLRASGRGLNLDRASLVRTTFLESTLPGSSFFAASGEGSSFQAAILDGADFRHAKLRQSQFFKASLDDARLFAADLVGSRFERASLARSDLEKANLMGASFNKAKLSETRFVGANLYDSKFFGATAGARCDFTGANLKLAAWK